jgi:hypothetical protein
MEAQARLDKEWEERAAERQSPGEDPMERIKQLEAMLAAETEKRAAAEAATATAEAAANKATAEKKSSGIASMLQTGAAKVTRVGLSLRVSD